MPRPDPRDRRPPFLGRSGPFRHTLAASLLLLLLVPTAAWPEETSSLRQLIETQFPRWDSNHDGSLELEEVNRQIEDRSVRGREAALVVVILRHVFANGNGDRSSVARQELLSSAEEPKFKRAVQGASNKLATLDRSLFLPGDPNLDSIRQGPVGDCYLLGPIAGAVHLAPNAIREMIRPAKNEGFEVVFGNGEKLRVPALTDAELLLGAKMDATHGIWLAVLEKAFGIIRARDKAKKQGKPADDEEIVPVRLIGGGHAGRIISLLTGHETEIIRNTQLAHKGGKVLTVPELRELLTQLTRHRRLVCCGFYPRKGAKQPPGIAGGHVHALLAYDTERREVTIFNPWGQTFKPKGEPGLANGYPTEHGEFHVPFDEFAVIFGSIVYETDRPIKDDGKPANDHRRKKK